MLKVYGRANAWNVRKVTFLIEDLGLPYERLDYGRGFAPTDTPDFLALNPNGFVPVLDDNGFILWESHTLLRYIAGKYGQPPLYPADVQQRARVDQWLDWKISHVAPAMRPLFFTRVLNSKDYTDKEVADAEADWNKYFTILDGQLGRTGAYVAGSDFTIADCAIGMAVHRFMTMPCDRPALQHVERYYGQLSERPSYQKTVLIGVP